MIADSNPSRRRFIKTFALFTATGSWLGTKWSGTLLAETDPNTDGILRININDYPVLLQNYGSVRIGITPMAGDYPQGFFYPILINRAPNNIFYALSTECTHESCTVPPYDIAEACSICPCHGSRYGIEGNVFPGSEASFPLRQFTTAFDGTSIVTVRVPELGYSIKNSIVQTGRLKLTFPTLLYVEYEVHFRENLGSPATPITFSTTPTGAITDTVLTGDGEENSIYVERTASKGFYTVTMKILEV